MGDIVPSRSEGREDVIRAFESLAVEVPENPTQAQIVRLNRALMDRYGGADPVLSLSSVTVVPVVNQRFAGEWIVPRDFRADLRIVYIHGGGWIGGGLRVYRSVGAELARASKCAVLVVDYRLAPENPYPASMDDCAAAITFAYSNGPVEDGQTERATVAVAGDSAGANLAAALTIRALQNGEDTPHRLALLSGVLDLAQSDFVPRNDPICSSQALAGAFAIYAQGKVAPTDPLASPIEAPRDVFEHFPPTLVQVSADEFFLESSGRFAAKLIEAGNRCSLSVWPLMPHSWHCFLDALPEARKALAEVAAFLAE